MHEWKNDHRALEHTLLHCCIWMDFINLNKNDLVSLLRSVCVCLKRFLPHSNSYIFHRVLFIFMESNVCSIRVLDSNVYDVAMA